ncbi:hypothetical protein LTR08_006322 [Meristemomyces frigidus]|nr:hypothetical protein LTR08_006322 [Meristemomyces frigidus]
MSEPIPESIPTSHSRLSSRPTKKRALNPHANNPALAQQSQSLDALFANPDRDISTASTSNGRGAAAPPEIVANVQGSSAGAGSGEFHVYKASRRRENERLRVMDEEVERERADAEFGAKQTELRRLDEAKLGKNRARREKARLRKLKAGGKGGDGGGEVEGVGGAVKKGLGGARAALSGARGGEEVEGGEGGDGQAGQDEGGITIHDDD